MSNRLWLEVSRGGAAGAIPLTEIIIAASVEPTAGNDLAAARQKVGDRLCLIGNIDISHVLVDGTREEVTTAVEEAVRDSAGGGFILAPTHTSSDIRIENIRWMIDAARRIEPR